MAKHDSFKMKTLNELEKEAQCMNLEVPISSDVNSLTNKVYVGDRIVPNSLAIHPMEGCDGTLNGEPGELTFRRYRRFASGGAGLIWFEASAIENDGRANPRQLLLSPENAGSFKKLFDDSMKAAQERYGQSFRPYTVIQLTHSGRYSRPDGQPKPLAAAKNKYLDEKLTVEPEIVSDCRLEALEDSFLRAALLAEEIGFDAVDIKSCHGYLISDMLSAHERYGNYGGSFENRTRFLLNVTQKIKQTAKSLDITLRLNAYDAVPFPSGWGVNRDDYRLPDLNEPLKLIKRLTEKNVRLINITAGNPYYNPHVNRPYDNGAYIPPEHPLEAVARLLACARVVQENFPNIAVVATGFSWLRDLAVNVAAGGIRDKWFKIAGFGRQAFAYPDFAADILEKGSMDKNKCCITCSKCSMLMRSGKESGCPVRDNDIYGSLLRG